MPKLPRPVAPVQGTLEEAVDADLLLHVIDASSPDAAAQHAAVVSILQQLGMTSAQLSRKVRYTGRWCCCLYVRGSSA